MIQQTELDTMKSLLEVCKQLIPLLTEKNIGKAIAGIEEAKAVIAEKNDVMNKADAIEAKAKDVETKLEIAANLKAKLDAQKDLIAIAEVSIKARQTALTEKEVKLDALLEKNQKQSATLEAAQLKADAAIAAAQAEHAIATAIKDEFNAKLSLVKAL